MFQKADVAIISSIEEASMPRKMGDWTSPKLKCKQTLARAIQSDRELANPRPLRRSGNPYRHILASIGDNAIEYCFSKQT